MSMPVYIAKVYSEVLKRLVMPIADKAMHTSLFASYRKIRSMKTWNREEIVKWQNTHLQKLVEHAYNHTRYYKELFDENGIRPEDVSSPADLQKLPVLRKEDIRNRYNDLIPDNIDLIPFIKKATGGSTGDPVPFLLDRKSWSFSNANTILNWERAGYHYGEKYIALGSTSLFVNKKKSYKHILYYHLTSKIGLSGINMSDDVCQDYVELVQKRKIRYIYGYASSLYLFAKYILKNQIKLNIIACFPTSEVLTDLYRKTISEAFQCKIVDSYGAHDGGVTAFSHQQGFFEVGYNCVVRLENPDENGTGAALLTDLFNHAMPLINYKIGDVYQIYPVKNHDYPYNGQVINKVLGRTSDIIYLENGNTLTGPGFTILFKDLPVEYYCIEKTGRNTITCSLIKLPDYSAQHEDLIISTIKKHAGKDLKVIIKHTNEYQFSKSGKKLYFKSS